MAWDDRFDEQLLEEPYCDLCERDGHTFRSCPARDDDFEDHES